MTRMHRTLALSAVAGLGLTIVHPQAAHADTPFVITTLNASDTTFTATGLGANPATTVTLPTADGSNAATLTSATALPVSSGTALGFSGGGTFGTTVVNFTAASATAPLTLTFANPVTEFGFYIADHSANPLAAGTFTFTITGSDGTVTPLTAAFTNESPFFFGAARTLALPTFTIKSVAITEVLTAGTVGSQNFYIGPVRALTAAPEPSQAAALIIGVLGLGALALKARRRARA